MHDDFPVMNRPLSPGTVVAYRLRRDGISGSSCINHGRVKQAGYYVILVTNDDGYEQFVFYDELLTVNEGTHMGIDASLLCVGCIILYKLLPAQNPTNPNRLWRGKVLSLHVGMPNSLDVALVECLDLGYAAGTEFVLLSQIEAVDTSTPIHSVHLLTINNNKEVQ